MKISLKKVVNGSIVIAFIGMLICFPFQDAFIGGLLFAACSAATIGGLADSFAVRALFGQPLKIRWPHWMGTNIIARNRERLIKELVDMVEHELLSPDIIIKQLKSYKPAHAIITYMTSEQGERALKELATRLLSDLLKVSSPAVISLSLKRLVKQGLHATRPTVVVGGFITWLIREQYDRKVASVLAKQLKQFIQQDAVKQFVYEFIATALRSYENNKKGRQFVNGIAGLNAEELTSKIMSLASDTLTGVENGEHALLSKLRQMLQQLVMSWEEDEKQSDLWNERIRKLGEAVLGGILTPQMIENAIQLLITQLADADDSSTDASIVKQWLDQQINKLLTRLSEQSEMHEQINHYMISTLTAFIERNHNYIGKLVREKLEQFDEQQLIELVEEKAGKDLQYIRLNGTFVGALIGVMLFLVQALIGGLLA